MKTKSFIAICLSILMLVSVCPITSQAKKAEMDFADVNVDDWSYEYIKYVFDHEYMIGISEDLFAPSEYITRAEMIQVLYKMSGLPAINEFYHEYRRFHDVEFGEWYYDATIWSDENKILVGTASTGANTNFAPNIPITRSDLAVAILRFADYLNLELKETDTTVKFKDIDQVPIYARFAVEELASIGIIVGKGDGIFDPNAGTTRAEAAAMIRSIVENTRERSTELLDRYGLSLTVSASRLHINDYRLAQRVVVHIKNYGVFKDDEEDLPEISIEGDIEGNNCHLYGFEFPEHKLDPMSPYKDSFNFEYICCVPESDLTLDPEGGRFHRYEVMKITLRVTIGDETETIIAYPSCEFYS